MTERFDFYKQQQSDNLEEAFRFYRAYWGDVLFDERGNERVPLSGDAIITLKKTTGYMVRLLPEHDSIAPNEYEARVNIIMNSDAYDHDTKLYLSFLSYIGRTLVNFMPLPKIPNNEKKYGLNGSVKNGTFGDFPDLFLRDVRKYYLGDMDGDVCLRRDIYEYDRNKPYFDEFGENTCNQETWKKYVEVNYLEDFFNEDDINYSNPIKLAFQRSPNSFELRFDKSYYPENTDTAKKLIADGGFEEYRTWFNFEIKEFLRNSCLILNKRKTRLELKQHEWGV